MKNKKSQELKVVLIDDKAKLPTKAYDDGDVGFDCYVHSKTHVYDTLPKQDDFTYVKYIDYNLGIKVQIPEGYFGMIVPRSSLTDRDSILKSSVGIIDSNYRGEIKLRLTPIFGQLMNDEYEIGDKCCQLILIEQPNISIKQVDELDESLRGEGGFGSSDVEKANIIDKKI